MLWANKIAEELIEMYPNEETFVCAAGVTPTGDISLNSLREAIITDIIRQALELRGKQAKTLFSWDDYDLFRREPDELSTLFSEYNNLPYSEIPDPEGCHATYVEHFESAFESVLSNLDIHPTYIYQHEKYLSGEYTADIREALKKRREIYDIIAPMKNRSFSESDRESYYPVHIYCRSCGKETMEKITYHEVGDYIEYTCACGYREFAALEGFNHMKLIWEVDWAMRWRHEGVTFEPGGPEHSAEFGSYQISSAIADQIFGIRPPYYLPYASVSSDSAFSLSDESSRKEALSKMATADPSEGIHIAIK